MRSFRYFCCRRGGSGRASKGAWALRDTDSRFVFLKIMQVQSFHIEQRQHLQNWLQLCGDENLLFERGRNMVLMTKRWLSLILHSARCDLLKFEPLLLLTAFTNPCNKTHIDWYHAMSQYWQISRIKSKNIKSKENGVCTCKSLVNHN